MKNRAWFTIFMIVFAIVAFTACGFLKKATDNEMVGNVVGKENVKMAKTGIEAGESLKAVYDAFQTMSIETERDLGEAVCLQAYATPGFGEPVRHQELMVFMHCMTNAIAQNSERPMIPYHVAVVKSDNVNAFSTPGGYIAITTGLIQRLDNEAQLAAVIGHEIAHVAKRHAADAIQKGQQVQSIFKLLQSGAKLTSSELAKDENFGIFEGMVKELAGFVSEHNFGADIEIESDKAGVRYAMDTGYNPEAMIDVLLMLKKAGKSGGDHPTAEQRIGALKEYINKELYKPEEGESVADLKAALVTSTGRLARVKQWISEYNSAGKWTAR